MPPTPTQTKPASDEGAPSSALGSRLEDDPHEAEVHAHAPVLNIEDLRMHFELPRMTVRAVDGVNLVVPRGKTVCVVGESGSGKSQTASCILRLTPRPGRIVGGRIVFHHADGETVLTDLPEDGAAIRRIRGGQISMIFQEPMTSLSPVHRVGPQILEMLRQHVTLPRAQARRRVIETMDHVGIPEPDVRYRQYPHELSGGLRQRAMIAMAMVCRPQLLIADEPTTALDVTTQSQILALMRDLQRDLDMAIMLITHDLSVVAEVADEVAVMYMGRVVEHASVFDLFDAPQHPYTQALLASMPGMDQARGQRLRTIRGSVPAGGHMPPGCPFHPRCPEAVAGKCDVGGPPPLLQTRPGHANACLIRHEEAHLD